MRGFYSYSPRVWRGESLRRAAEGPQPDPYASHSPGHRERTRQTVTQIGTGMARVDIGEPIARVHGAPQPVPVGSPADTCEEPDAAPEETRGTEEDARDLLSVLRSTSLPAYKPGLGRG